MKMCEFKNMKEFAKNKTINKLIYTNMDYVSRKELKNYIYKEINDRSDKKDIIWEYLNEPIDSETYMWCSKLLTRCLGEKDEKDIRLD